MSWVFDPASQCEGKQRFGSPSLAHKVLSRKTDRNKNRTVYHCEHCGGWHLGHGKSRDKRHQENING